MKYSCAADTDHSEIRGYKKIKSAEPLFTGFADCLVGVEGFEPSEWQSQSLLPYRLATPQYFLRLCYDTTIIACCQDV